MARDEAPLFERGNTLWEGDTSNIDASGFNHILGKEWRIEDPDGSGQYVTLRAVRVVTGGLKGKDIVAFKAGSTGTVVDNYAGAGAECAVLDDQLTGNVAKNDIAYVITKGPTKVVTKTSSPNVAQADKIAAGGGGRVQKAAAGSFALGIALEAATTSETSKTIKVIVGADFARDAHD